MDATTESAESVSTAQEMEAAGTIEPLSNIVNEPVYVVSFTDDEVVHPSHQDSQYAFYQSLGANVHLD